MECHGCVGKDGRFWCGAAGSEDCDFECPNNRLIGKTQTQVFPDIEETHSESTSKP